MREYKIMQFTDCHLDDGTAEAGLEQIAALWEHANADLAVFTGDVVFGKNDLVFYDRLDEFFRSRNAPFAVVLGNHEGEANSTDRRGIMEKCASLVNCITEVNPIGKRYGNYVYDTPFDGVSLAMLDSGDYAPWYEKLRHPIRSKYAAVTKEQISWYVNAVKDKKAVFVFLHIPVPEYERAYYGALARGEVKYGALRENIASDGSLKRVSDVVCSSAVNTGFFESARSIGNLKAIFCGHDHLNDFYVEYKGVGLVYGQKTVGFAGSGYAFDGRGFPDYTGATLVTVYENGDFTPRQIYYKDIR